MAFLGFWDSGGSATEQPVYFGLRIFKLQKLAAQGVKLRPFGPEFAALPFSPILNSIPGYFLGSNTGPFINVPRYIRGCIF
jgi:hypothetical protein